MEKYVEEFLKLCQARLDENYASSPFKHVISAVKGKKYYKVIVADIAQNGEKISSYAHSFIDAQTGDLFKAANFKAPAKGIRSNITSEDFGMSGILLSGTGAVYFN